MAQNTNIEYTAEVVSPLVSGEAKLSVSEKALTVTALFDVAEVAFTEMNALAFEDYVITVKADSGDYKLSKMGNWAQPFYETLCEAYNKAVLRSLFIKGDPELFAKGDYSYIEKTIQDGLNIPAGKNQAAGTPAVVDGVGSEALTAEAPESADGVGSEALTAGTQASADGVGSEALAAGTQASADGVGSGASSVPVPVNALVCLPEYPQGFAPIYVYEDSLVNLPPDLGARRVPLCFVAGMEKGDYSLTLRLDTGDSYTYSKLGYETEPFANAIEKNIRAIREKTITRLKEIDPSLEPLLASKITKLMPMGAAASLGQLTAIAPSFAAALEAKIASTRASDSFNVFKELSSSANIYVGLRKNEAFEERAEGVPENPDDLPSGLAGGNNLMGAIEGIAKDGNAMGATEGLVLDGIQSDSIGSISEVKSDSALAEIESNDPYLLWMIAPSPNGQHAAVEFAEANSATFIYRTNGNFTEFAMQLNRALEAIAFKREVIRLTDEELLKAENADYYMASKRTRALQFIRANFMGRIIHSGVDAWKSKLYEMWDIKGNG